MKKNNKPIRILQVFGEMNVGGAETMIMNIYRNINREKIQFDFMVHTDKKCFFDGEIKKLGGKIYRVPKYKGLNHFKYKKEWNDFFKIHNEYKIIHGHMRSTASIYLKIAKKYNKITIVHSHNTSSGKGVRAILKNILQYTIRYNSDYFLACSKGSGKWLFGDKIVKSDKFNILYNTIDLEKFKFDEVIKNEYIKKFNIEGKFIIGHVGRFHKQKNHKFILDIFEEVLKINPNSKLILIGDGNLKANIENIVENKKLINNVIFTGIRDDVNNIMQVMDVFLFPSFHEGLPLTLVEAQASSINILCSDNITDEIILSDLVNKYSLSNSASSWANKLINLKKKEKSKKYINEIINKGYDLNSVTNWIMNYYLKLNGEKYG